MTKYINDRVHAEGEAVYQRNPYRASQQHSESAMIETQIAFILCFTRYEGKTMNDAFSDTRTHTDAATIKLSGWTVCGYCLLPLLLWTALLIAALYAARADSEQTLFWQIATASTHSIAIFATLWLIVSLFLVIVIRQLLTNSASIKHLKSSIFILNNEMEAAVAARADQQAHSMQTLQTISRQAPGIVYQYLLRTDGSSAIPYANDQLFEIFGLHPEEVARNATRFLDHIHPDDLAEFITSTSFSARDLTPWQHEFRITDAQGRERWLLGDTVPQARDNGLILWHGFITDITQRKRAEIDLQRHKVIIDTAQDGFWRVDINGNLREVNQAYADMTGYSIEELLHLQISDLEAP